MNFEIKALANNEAEVHIYGVIGREENNPKDFISQLKSVKSETLHIHINSPGGDLFAGHVIYGIIKNFKGKKITYIDGLAASAASIIAMAGDKVVMPRNTLLMIHNASTVIHGDSQEFAKAAGTLEKMNATMQAVYHNKTGIAHDEIATMMNNETWFTADEALKLGFIDIVVDDIELDSHYEDNGNLILNGIDFGNVYAEKIKQLLPLQIATTTPVANFLPKGATMLTIEALQKDNPDIYAKIFEAGKLSGVEAGKQIGISAERQRIKDIEEMESNGHADLVAKAKFETGDSAGSLAVAILKAEKDQRSSLLAVNQSEADAVNKVVAAQLDPIAGIDPRAKAEEAFFAGVKDFAGVK
ncbi:MAG: Clp protease ClpP [Burkholderiales bacterium]|nr:Clp protease ClpP [Burkholderiales bacterium]